MSTTTSPARVVAKHGQMLRLTLADGSEGMARVAGRAMQPVCGDRVQVSFDERHNQWLVVELLQRTSVLYRSNARGGGEAIAANLTLLAVVCAPVPEPDLFVVDRYLAAAAAAGIEGLVLVNKEDLGLGPALQSALDEYDKAGYRHLCVSAQDNSGTDALAAALRTQCTILLGQSGVGKSSILRRLDPQAQVATGELMRGQEGRHTTTTARLYQLPTGGELIDAPGVRDFAPDASRLPDGDLGFLEIAALRGRCRFPDCRHLNEPDCAVIAAVGTTVGARRYESYRRLLRLRERLGQMARGW